MITWLSEILDSDWLTHTYLLLYTSIFAFNSHQTV